MEKFNIIEKELMEQYGLKADKIEKSSMGAGSDVWFITCDCGKYVMKYPAESEINNPYNEVEICNYLLQKGIPACEFIKNNKDEYISYDCCDRVYHLQKFTEGKVYGWNTMSGDMLMESAAMLGKIHNALKDYNKLSEGIGENFFKYMTPEHAEKSYENSLVIAINQNYGDIFKDVKYRLKLMKSFPEYNFKVDKFTCQSTHGDYFISQLICGENSINAVIDWTTACIHPVVWEIVRSYVYASKECSTGKINMDQFVKYVKVYCQYANLNEYDLANMVDLFYYQLAVCDYYGQYFSSKVHNKYIYLQQAVFSTKLLKWLKDNKDDLTKKLVKEVNVK